MFSMQRLDNTLHTQIKLSDCQICIQKLANALKSLYSLACSLFIEIFEMANNIANKTSGDYVARMNQLEGKELILFIQLFNYSRNYEVY